MDVNTRNSTAAREQINATRRASNLTKDGIKTGEKLGATARQQTASRPANPTPTSSSISQVIAEATDGDTSEAIRLSGSGAFKSRPAGTAHDEATDGDNAEVNALAKSGRLQSKNKQRQEQLGKQVEPQSEILDTSEDFKSKSGFNYSQHIERLKGKPNPDTLRAQAENEKKLAQANSNSSVDASSKTSDISATESKKSGASSQSALAAAKRKNMSLKPAELGTEMASKAAVTVGTIFEKQMFTRNFEAEANLLQRQRRSGMAL